MPVPDGAREVVNGTCESCGFFWDLHCFRCRRFLNAPAVQCPDRSGKTPCECVGPMSKAA